MKVVSISAVKDPELHVDSETIYCAMDDGSLWRLRLSPYKWKRLPLPSEEP